MIRKVGKSRRVRGSAPGAEPEDSLRARAAWLYYVADLRQDEVADRLGVTRTRANRLLAEARAAGIVSVQIDHAAARLQALEEAIRGRFSLDFCIATPPLGAGVGVGVGAGATDRRVLGSVGRRAVGISAAHWLAQRLAEHDGPVIGVGWGRTLAEMATNLDAAPAPGARFVSLMGALSSNAAASPFEVAHALAARVGGRAHFLPAPFLADTAGDAAVLRSQRAVAETLALGRRADFHLVSVGEVDEQALLGQLGLLTADELAELRGLGVVADTVGHFFDAEGQRVAHPLHDRAISLEIEALEQTPVVLLAAGPEKLLAAEALLRTGLVSGLIIDGDTAGALAGRSGGGVNVAA